MSISTADGDEVPHFGPQGQVDVSMVDDAGNNTFDIAYGNYLTGGGARVAAENTRRTIEHLRALVEEQEQQIAEMAERLARYEDQAAKRRVPAIH